MDQIKIDNFLKENPEKEFPNYEHLDNTKSADIRSRICEKLGVSSSADSLNLVQQIEKYGHVCVGVHCNENNFDLKKAFLSIEVECPKNVYISWYRFDDIDKLRFADLAEKFDDIWYESVDDLDIFDDSFSWIVSVTHYGQLKFIRLEAPE